MNVKLIAKRHNVSIESPHDSVYDAACTALHEIEYNLSYPFGIIKDGKIIWQMIDYMEYAKAIKELEKLAGH